jgi:hypothetical protein
MGANLMLSQGHVDVIYSEVGFYTEDVGHTYFCELLAYLQSVRFQLFALYGFGGLKYIEDSAEPCYPWANALFVRNALVQAKYGEEYRRWLAGIRPSI